MGTEVLKGLKIKDSHLHGDTLGETPIRNIAKRKALARQIRKTKVRESDTKTEACYKRVPPYSSTTSLILDLHQKQDSCSKISITAK